ncbi:hypothetical protein VMCG_01451 [Cytospora schulzeri]|uniref:Secreted protein n=1 Tax=Cytospora schulzeri TaxID=448051 RepID=A0A423X702_9PEZI|nr:hypothetical protein VMCG_01451 [Valsa malicola]
MTAHDLVLAVFVVVVGAMEAEAMGILQTTTILADCVPPRTAGPRIRRAALPSTVTMAPSGPTPQWHGDVAAVSELPVHPQGLEVALGDGQADVVDLDDSLFEVPLHVRVETVAAGEAGKRRARWGADTVVGIDCAVAVVIG